MADPEPAVAVDADNADAGSDSAYDSELASYTTTLASSVTDYKFHHGRRYHAYKEGAYPYPNDEGEKDRLDIAHKMVETCLRGKLFTAPLTEPKRILDLGTGTGIWAIEVGDMFPKADVLGNDLSPIQPRWVPPNVRFEVDDIEADWTFSGYFDFIFCRQMGATLRDWPRLMKQCFDNVAPGGYAEFIEYDLTWTSPDGSLPEDSQLKKTNMLFLKTLKEAGIEPNAGLCLEEWMKKAGFVDVTVTKYPLPVGTWAADKHLKEIGAWNFLQINEGLEGLSMLTFINMGYSKEEVEVMCAKMRAEFKNPKIHTLFHLYSAYGKKPEAKSTADDDK